MRVLQEVGDVRPQVELSLGNYKVNGASIACGRRGTKFAFTIGPRPDAAVAALVATAHHHGRICLLLPEPLLLDLVAVERKEQQRVRIAGRIVGSTSDGGDMESRSKRVGGCRMPQLESREWAAPSLLQCVRHRTERATRIL
jgi:hypothetical protein